MKKFILASILSLLTALSAQAGVRDEVNKAKSESPEYREQQQNIWITIGLRKAVQKTGRAVQDIEFDPWNACGLNVEGTIAYVKLSDGASCKVSVNHWSGNTIEGVFECYRNQRAVPGFEYDLKYDNKQKFTMAKTSKATRAASACWE